VLLDFVEEALMDSVSLARCIRRTSIVAVLSLVFSACNSNSNSSPAPAPSSTAAATVTLRAPGYTHTPATFTVTSSTFPNGGAIPLSSVYSGCGGGNISPQLSWSGAPAGTLSYIVTLFDESAATGVGLWHWTIFNIPASVTSLATNASTAPPAGSIQGYTDFSVNKYSGPCPPPGDGAHTYKITVLALNTATVASAGTYTTGAVLTFDTLSSVIGTATYIGTYASQ